MFFTSTWLLILSAISETCGATADEHKQKLCKNMRCSVIDAFLEVLFLVLGSALFTSLLLKTSLRLWFLGSPPAGSKRPEGKLHQMCVNVSSAYLTYCQTGCPSEQITLFLFWLTLVSYFHSLIWISRLRPKLSVHAVLFSFQEDKTKFCNKFNVSVSLIFLFSLANSLSPQSECVYLYLITIIKIRLI